MQPLIIKKTEETPAIVFIPDKNIFRFVATSWPENASIFYSPVLEWLENYFNDAPLDLSIFQFRYSYFNTASAKQIAKILVLLKKYSQKHNMRIEWCYEKDDYDMKKEGQRFAAILKIKFDFVER